MPEVEKIEIRNNEFRIKHRIIREQPARNLILYHEGPQPTDLDNWLLDVQLAYGELRTDQAAVWLGELGLGPEYSEIVHRHMEFFNSDKRRDKLKSIVDKEDSPGLLRLKLTAVCAYAEPRIDDILENLLVELAENKEEKINLIQRCGLNEFFFKQLQRFYGYQSKSSGIKDFAIQLFKSFLTRVDVFASLIQLISVLNLIPEINGFLIGNIQKYNVHFANYQFLKKEIVVALQALLV